MKYDFDAFDEPLTPCYDRNLFSILQVSKMINNPKVGRTIIFNLLKKNGVIDNLHYPNPEWDNKGLFVTIKSFGYNPYLNSPIYNVLKVTTKGAEFIRKLVQDEYPVKAKTNTFNHPWQ